MRVSTKTETSAAPTRIELLAAAGETVGLFLIFIVAFTGRDKFGDGVKLALVVLSLIVGGGGVGAGVAIARRGLQSSQGRSARLVLAAFMIFIGAYSIVHVLQ
jgi:hypothetical protein